MRKLILTALVGAWALALGPNPAAAQVKQVEMNIAGYLCGF